MQIKHILTVGTLYILCTSVCAFARPNEFRLKEFKSLPPPKAVIIKTQLPKDLKSLSDKMVLRSGGVDTGGGTIVQSSQGIGLLDLYLYNQEAFSNRRLSTEVYNSRSLKNLGVDLLTNKEQPIVQKTLAQISKWNESSPILTRYLKLALENLRLYIHQGSFHTGPLEYYLPKDSKISSSDLKMVAIYTKGFGVHVGLDDFNQLPETHQIALLIHESLRAMSIAGDFNYSNETIQRLTATLMSSPASGESLDSNIYLNGKVLDSHLDFLNLITKVQALKKKVCSNDHAFNFKNCDIQERDATVEGARQVATDLFSKLYAAPKSSTRNQLLAEAYNIVTRFENSTFQDLLSEAKLLTLPQGYLTMLLDSYIDDENTRVLHSTDTATIKNSLRTYFLSIGVDITYHLERY